MAADRRAAAQRRITLGADKAYDVADFVAALRARSISAHVAIDGHPSKTGKPRRTAVDRRTTRHAGYEISQRCRKRIEEVFGWVKAVGRAGQDQAARTRPRRRRLHPGVGRLQPDPPAQADGGADMSLRGRWRDRRDAGLRHGGRTSLHRLAAGPAASSPWAASLAPSTAPARVMPSSSAGTATTRWSRPAAPAGPTCKTTGRSTAKYPSNNGDDIAFIARR